MMRLCCSSVALGRSFEPSPTDLIVAWGGGEYSGENPLIFSLISSSSSAEGPPGIGLLSERGDAAGPGVASSGVNPPGVVAPLFKNGFIACRRLPTGLGSTLAAMMSALEMGSLMGATRGGGDGGRRGAGRGGSGTSASTLLFFRLRKKLDGFFCSVLGPSPCDDLWLSRDGGLLVAFIWLPVCWPGLPALSTEVDDMYEPPFAWAGGESAGDCRSVDANE